MKRFVLFLLTLILVTSGWGQQKTRVQLSGHVTDAKTGEPLAGASVMISDTKYGTSTDSAGYYLLENIPVGHTVLEVSNAGYRSIVEHLDITGNTEKNFSLSSAMIVIEGITVTGVAGATSMRKAPVTIDRVNKAELLATPATNIIDALSRQPGVSQLQTGPAVSKPIIRGLGYNRLVVINDGIRQEGQQWGDEHGIEVDENSVSRVEILKGPASIIYGSDAIAGVVNIITAVPVPVNTVRGSLLSSYQTNNKQRSFFADIGGNHSGFNWNAWGDYKAAADYKNKYDGPVYNSKFNERNFGGYIGYNGAWGFSHLVVSNFNQRLGVIEGARDSLGRFVKPLPGGLESIPTESDFASTDPQVPYQHVQHFKVTSDNSFKAGTGRLTLNLGAQRNQRKEFGNVDAPGKESLFFDLRTFNYSTAYHFAHKNQWTTTIGINGMAQGNQNKGEEVLIPEYNLFDAGLFFYAQKTLEKATFSGGVRYDNRSLESKEFKDGGDVKFTGFTKSFSNVSGSVGVSYAANDYFVWKVNLARGFRAPSIPELASNGTHEGTNRYEYGDPGLKSEISWQADAGVELNSEHLLFTFSTFYNHINNFIFYSKLSGKNGSDSLVDVQGDLIPAFKFSQRNASLYGAEGLVDLHPHPLDWLHWENTVSYVRGVFASPIEGVNNVPFIPATRWNSELRAELLPKGKVARNLTVHFEAQHTFTQNKPFTAYGTETATPGYTLLNTGLSTNIVSGKHTLFTIYLNAQNLGDVAYQSHLSRLKYTDVNLLTGRQGVFNMGRNYSIKVNIPIAIK